MRFDVETCTSNVDENIVIESVAAANKVVLIGVGKSYLACLLSSKIANSYGLKWYALEAFNCFHGDAGIINPSDVMILVSKSGETEEVVRLAQLHSNNKIAITFSPHSNSLADLCHITINSRDIKEESPFERAPMTTTLLTQRILNRIITLVVLEKGLTQEDFTNHHSGGALGRLYDE